ncbi:MAG: DNA adenine methylase [Lachnospiraceae bacterium]|nr:DNA adenine methylase [Lachnospiraceae bacterium]
MNKPLIKWPGGKSSEIRQFLSLIPDYDRYIEPFVGGGALYFYLRPQSAIINDISENLMEFYRLVKENDPELHRILDLQCRSFDALKNQCRHRFADLMNLYLLIDFADREKLDISRLGICGQLVREIAGHESVLCELIPDREEFFRVMERSVEDKLIRTARNNRKKTFSEKDLKANIVTGFTGGYYLYFRGVFNDIAARRMLCSPPYRAANFYFIREYCYGSMFRYNSNGEFNIPYGGVSYDKKDLHAKIEAIFSEETISLLARTQLFCQDFEELMNSLTITERDFLFLDPPYDTEFSDYEGKDFAREDQRRLAAFLEKTSAKFLLVIKNTEFIAALYANLPFRVLTVENRYSYNVRSRNDRRSEHLLITNIPEDTIPWLRENRELEI